MCMCSGRSPKVVQKHAPGSDQGARSMSLDTGKGISLIIECWTWGTCWEQSCQEGGAAWVGEDDLDMPAVYWDVCLSAVAQAEIPCLSVDAPHWEASSTYILLWWQEVEAWLSGRHDDPDSHSGWVDTHGLIYARPPSSLMSYLTSVSSLMFLSVKVESHDDLLTHGKHQALQVE